VTVARIRVAGLHVPVIEATFIVVVRTVEYRVHALSRIASGYAACLVVAISDTWRDENAIHPLTIQFDRCTCDGLG
jgi:hypothetical protein